MRYWDASALVPLLVDQGPWTEVRRLSRLDPEIATWWGSGVECASALARLARAAWLGKMERAAFAELVERQARWQVVPPSASVEQEAVRLVRVHPLRAGDALQLAAARAAADGHPDRLEFVTLDRRLAGAASIEGFPVIAPGQELY